MSASARRILRLAEWSSPVSAACLSGLMSGPARLAVFVVLGISGARLLVLLMREVVMLLGELHDLRQRVARSRQIDTRARD